MRKPTFLGHNRPLLTDMVLKAMRAVRDNLDLVPFRA